MTKHQKQLVSKWVKLLRVQDWEMTWKEKKRFKGAPSQTGWTKTSPNFKEATIAIKKGLGDSLFELTLIHELVHVLFPSFKYAEESALYMELEQGVEILARLLQRLEHGARSRR